MDIITHMDDWRKENQGAFSSAENFWKFFFEEMKRQEAPADTFKINDTITDWTWKVPNDFGTTPDWLRGNGFNGGVTLSNTWIKAEWK